MPGRDADELDAPRSRSRAASLERRDRRPAGDAVPALLQGVRDPHRLDSRSSARAREGTRRALITGIGGQDGLLLAELLLERGLRGLRRRPPRAPSDYAEPRRRSATGSSSSRPTCSTSARSCDALASCRAARGLQPRLASFVPASWDEPVLTAEFAAVGVTTMLEAIRRVDPAIRFYQASSSEIFGEPQRGAADRGHAARAR